MEVSDFWRIPEENGDSANYRDSITYLSNLYNDKKFVCICILQPTERAAAARSIPCFLYREIQEIAYEFVGICRLPKSGEIPKEIYANCPAS